MYDVSEFKEKNISKSHEFDCITYWEVKQEETEKGF